MNSKKTITLLVLATLLLTLIPVIGIQAKAKQGEDVTTIQDGTLLDSEGNPLVLGFDEYGYNYQAHMFRGLYDDYDRVHGGAYPDVYLTMKWNDAWISNVDRGTQLPNGGAFTDLYTPDGLLDRHYGFTSYIGSGAWLTNHQSGSYEDEVLGTVNWNYFVKIVAVPADAVLTDGIWYTAGGTEIGTAIWGEFAIIQQVYNDAGEGVHGLEYLSPTSAGLGAYK